IQAFRVGGGGMATAGPDSAEREFYAKDCITAHYVTDEERTLQTLYSPRSSASGCMSSMCSATTLITTTTGTQISIPATPQSQPPKSRATNTAMAFILAMRPVIQVATSVPITEAIARLMVMITAIIVKDSNCRKPAAPVPRAVMRVPK